jgi:2-polyprenyl-6-methoxyphenol hydroxylase-like FAD-dependent oxidoreductase
VKESYDIVIVGGGMVGASLALALAPLPWRIAVVEAFAPSSESQPSYDDRATALAEGSRRIFDTLGVWPALAPSTAPIRRIRSLTMSTPRLVKVLKSPPTTNRSGAHRSVASTISSNCRRRFGGLSDGTSVCTLHASTSTSPHATVARTAIRF